MQSRMDFTPTTDDVNLDDLKQNVIDSNLGQPSVSEESLDTSLESLDDVIDTETKTFSMDDISVDDVVTEAPSAPVTDEVADSTVDPIQSTQEAVVDDSVPVVDQAVIPATAPIVDPNAADADLSKITIEEKVDAPSAPTFAFDEEEEKVEKTFAEKLQDILHFRIQTHSLTWYVLGIGITILSLLAAAYFYYAERYVYYKTRPADTLDPTAEKILARVETYRGMLQTVGLVSSDDVDTLYLEIDPDKDLPSLQALLQDDSISYVAKYDNFGAYMNLVDRRTPELYDQLLRAREELASYPFFPDSLQQLIDPDNDSSLQRSLLSLEAVKFRTAIAVFSKFDTFIRQFALDTGRTQEEIQAFMDSILERGDRDIDYYLNTCYLNPYELPDSCTQYGDFARMYAVYESDDEDAGIDTGLFAKLMGFIDNKLEKSVLPSLALSTSDFDPINQQLTLVIDVNTLPDDTLQLLKQGILNPHVYVVGHMINFLRQSKFIISEDINVNALDINKIVVPVGSKEVTVSTSHFEFTLPLQKSTQREITDYFIRTQRTELDYLGSDEESDDIPLSGDVLDEPLLDDDLLDEGPADVVLSDDDLALSGDVDDAIADIAVDPAMDPALAEDLTQDVTDEVDETPVIATGGDSDGSFADSLDAFMESDNQ